MTKKIFYVDLPIHHQIGPDAEWTNISTFETKEEAIQFIRENIDGTSTDGQINLIVEGQTEEEDES